MMIVSLAAQFLPLVRSGAKRSTIRKGRRPWAVGTAILSSKADEQKIYITDVRFTNVASLTAIDAAKDGFETLGELLAALQGFYPELSFSDEITIASFRIDR
jgi:hypothetical protein